MEYAQEYPSNITTLDECIVSYLTQLKQSFANMIDTIHANSDNVCELIGKLVSSVKSKTQNESEHTDALDLSVDLSLEKDMDNMRLSAGKKDLEIRELSEKCDKLKEKSQKDFDDAERLRFRVDQLQKQVFELQKRESDQQSQLEKLRFDKEMLEKTIKNNDDEQKEAENALLATQKTKNGLFENAKSLESSTLDAYLKQIDVLNQRIQYLDSKAFYYYDEMKSMLERLKLQIDAYNAQEHDLNEIKDQLERTRSSYEVQMSTMSDHIIEMTDRMTRQAEENEQLKHELTVQQANQNAAALLNSKGSSKSKKSK